MIRRSPCQKCRLECWFIGYFDPGTRLEGRVSRVHSSAKTGASLMNKVESMPKVRLSTITPVLLSMLLFAAAAQGGPNLVAVGSFDLPYKEAELREGINEKELIFEFDGEHDFGRIV